MVTRKGELNSAHIDRAWPHQVALPATAVHGANYSVVHGFCKDLSLCRRGHSFRRDDVDYIVFCFAEHSHAQQFCTRFDGELMAPADRPRLRQRR